MKKIIFPFACFCAFVLTMAFTSCKKEPIEVAKNDLQDFQWRITAQTVNGADNFSKIPACNQDDIAIYKEAGSVVIDQSVVKCTGNTDQQTTNGTWALSNEGKTLTVIDAKKVETVYTITELSDTTLKLEVSKDLGAAKVAVVTTFTKVK